MIFEPVELDYQGETYRVEPENVLMLIATIEEYVTIAEITSRKPKFASLALGFAAALRFAGAKKVDDSEVYAQLFSDGDSQAAAVIGALLAMMIPPAELAETVSADDGGTGKPESASA